MEFDPSAYLRGRKVAVKLAKRAVGADLDEEVEVETVWLGLSNNEVAKIEEHFGGVIAFDQAYSDRQVSAVRAVLAIALGAELLLVPGKFDERGVQQPVHKVDPEVLEQVGARMIDTEFPTYVAAVEAMWLLAHGSTEEDAGKAWEARVQMALAGHRMVIEAFKTEMKAIGSPGGNGSKRGPSRADRSKSSGA